MQEIPKSVLRAYDVGELKEAKAITSGLLHKTYSVRTTKGRFVLQSLHPVLAGDAVGQDFFAVTETLREADFPAPRGLLTTNGHPQFKEGKRVWRLQTFIAGKSHETVTRPSLAAEAGKLFAQFHQALNGMRYRFGSPLKLHETEKIYKAFAKTIRAAKKSPLFAEVEEDVAFLLDELPKLFLPKNLPKRVIHGDPKITNVLFDTKGKAVAIVDLDTCNRMSVLVELGDAFRSWCGGREDDPKNTFNLAVFRAGWKGYAKEAGGFLTAEEIRLVPQSIGLITLELAMRFLKDYFDDSYFGFDQKRYPSRRAHNLARARGQIALYKDLRKKWKHVESIV